MTTEFSDMPERPEFAGDPLGLEAVDQQIRINELRTQVEALGMRGGGAADETPPEIEEAFLRNVIDYEMASMTTHFARLEKAGVKLPPPDELDAAAITVKLWEVIHALAQLDTFLGSTNHLSDRELYAHLWNDSLREETPDFPQGSGWNCHLDLVGSGSDEQMELYLRYYADEKTREHWRRDFPGTTMPPKERPPFDRDRLLPWSEGPV